MASHAPTTINAVSGGDPTIPPDTIESIKSRFGPFVAQFAEVWLNDFLGRYHQHSPLAAMVITTCLCVLVSNYSFVSSLPGKLARLVVSSVTSSIVVRQTDTVALEVIKWIMVHIVLPRRPKTLLAVSNKPMYLTNDKDGDHGYGLCYGMSNNKKEKKSPRQDPNEIRYYPGQHKAWFFRGWRLFMVQMPKDPGGQEQRLEISTLGFSCQPIMDFMDECRAWAAASERTADHIRIYMTSKYGSFSKVIHMPLRGLDTIYLDEKLKQDLLDDMANYLHPESERYYREKGNPYRRGYLLHGPPGTGKSSLVNALAGHFDLPVYTVDLGSVDDDISLQQMFKSIQPRSIVLLEDIDANQIATSRKYLARFSGGASITLSGLLNTLDDALKRPGRADRHFYIGPLTKRSAKDMFLHQLGDDHGNTSRDGQSDIGDKALLEEMADKFSQSIPEDLITPATPCWSVP
ncbi:hypothetical protein PG991_008695 [Apiospora marii]|uniref:AAA+ ATPase domain-containing protein n=1 Tax=Apiospora marii TaxID=335849 RepID=A0ABR1RLR8_9PEZI